MPSGGAQQLFQELLQTANGDTALARSWMTQMGYGRADIARAESQSNGSKQEMRAEVEATAPAHFVCPIAMHIMRDPVVLSTGQTYDRTSIERWLASGRNKCPTTNQVLPEPITLTPNLVLKRSIEDWAARRAPWLLDETGHLKAASTDRTDEFLRANTGMQTASASAVNVPGLSEANNSYSTAHREQSQSSSLAIGTVAGAAVAGGLAGAAVGGLAGASVSTAPAYGASMPSVPPMPYANDAAMVSAVSALPSEQAYDSVPMSYGAPGMMSRSRSQSPARSAAVGPVDGSLARYTPDGFQSPPTEWTTLDGEVQGGKPRGLLWSPMLVTAEVLLAVVAWLVVFILSIWQTDWSLASLVTNPWAGASVPALLRLGAQSNAAVAGAGQGWRILTSPFVSAGVIQLVPNIALLSTYARLLERALPRPVLALPAIFLLGSFIGALASANLNVYYVTTGGTAGVAALLGAAWVEQCVHWRRYQLQPVTFTVLFLTTGVLGTLSVLPLQDFWYLATSFCVGAAMTGAMAAAGGLRSGRRHRVTVSAATVAVLGLLIVGGAAVAAVGVGLNSSAGKQCGEGCAKLSCAPLEWWQCVPTPRTWFGDCGFGLDKDDSVFVQCPSGLQVPLTTVSNLDALNATTAATLCTTSCDNSVPSASPSGISPSSSSPSPSPSPTNNGIIV